MKKILISISLIILLTPLSYANGKLVFVSMITRHGDRAPFANIDNANYKWGTPLSELTPIGMNQEYNLGKHLRERYVDQFKLLPKQYQDLSISVTSSHTNRTVVSAQSMLMGLYPPSTGPMLANGKPALPDAFQPIPIMVLPEDSKLIMFPYLQYLQVLDKNTYKTKWWKNKNKGLQPQFKRWTSILGNKITGLDDVLTVGDVLIVAKAHNKPLPKGLTQKDADQIIHLTEWGLSHIFDSQKVSYILGGQLTNKMLQDLNDAADGKSKYKMTYYSGHDLTLLAVMGTLGVPLQKASGYASNLQLELYKDTDTYIVKLRYDGKYVKLPIMNDDDTCTLKALNKYIDSINKKYKSQ
jgi:acid phosphatase